ncbi:class I SAM-dependent methyltransferase [Flavobacterium suncheonense]|uniref:SAM-dependent methyltransferase n=1 Tax=Flavobacterium suncheonense GH29-5 = DSM 17707 TaxID=1121899 RepID=A0A0A2MKM8_9FLAO|nr:class I SAM-dependent methyltransferase [Flavobacterium suncheonense]KGO88875.1 SAM-dependent methyltransferase [Flavobacterium suncheonense GH29-5 = DSM 17707]
MKTFNRKAHWESIYNTKALNEVSWYQPTPKTSLDFIQKHAQKGDAIIDVGGGDSFLTDHLLELGYTNLTVLDISEKAINRAKARLGAKADVVKWIVCDITEFEPTEQYTIWHDRAVFHFLTDAEDIAKYQQVVASAVTAKGKKLIGTFSESGPKKCSGIEIKQYSGNLLKETFKRDFEPLECFFENHTTPFDTIQNFVFCSFEKK